jgi:hypothetical protein
MNQDDAQEQIEEDGNNKSNIAIMIGILILLILVIIVGIILKGNPIM